MGLFSKKETLIQNMTFMGIFSAINVVISLLSTILFAVATPISILLIIVLPLTSTVVELFCKDKYYPIYLFSTIGLSLVVTMWDMQNTIFYLIPSVFTGYIFGLLTKKRISGIYTNYDISCLMPSENEYYISLYNPYEDEEILIHGFRSMLS